MRIAGYVVLVFAGLLFLGGLKTAFWGNGTPITDSSGLGVSSLVGAFLLPVLATALGLWLLQKSK